MDLEAASTEGRYCLMFVKPPYPIKINYSDNTSWFMCPNCTSVHKTEKEYKKHKCITDGSK